MEDTAMHRAEDPPGTRDVRPVRFSQASPCGAETILLVDDIDMVRALMRIILEAQGYAVLEAASGEDAVLLAATYAGSIDLLLTDLLMQAMSGPELAGRILSDRRTTRVLYMSGCREEAVLERHGVSFDSGILQKPFAPGTLLRKVRDALGGMKGLSDSAGNCDHRMSLGSARAVRKLGEES